MRRVYTHNVKLKNKLVKMAKKCPGLYRLKDKNAYGGVMYIFPKKYLTIMFREEISDELKASRRLGYENAQLEKTARKTAGKTPDTDEVRQTPDQAEKRCKISAAQRGFSAPKRHKTALGRVVPTRVSKRQNEGKIRTVWKARIESQSLGFSQGRKKAGESVGVVNCPETQGTAAGNAGGIRASRGF